MRVLIAGAGNVGSYLAEDQAFPPTMSPSEIYRFYSDCYPSWDWDFAEP